MVLDRAQVLSGTLEHTAAPEDSRCFLFISVDFCSSTGPLVRPGEPGSRRPRFSLRIETVGEKQTVDLSLLVKDMRVEGGVLRGAGLPGEAWRLRLLGGQALSLSRTCRLRGIWPHPPYAFNAKVCPQNSQPYVPGCCLSSACNRATPLPPVQHSHPSAHPPSLGVPCC